MTDTGARTHTDIRRGGWIDRLLPSRLVPYARLARWDRPIGTWLLLLPGWWAIALAAPGSPDFGLMALFGIGAILTRGAGCTLNDILDRDIDARVERTRTRPLPSGHVSVRQAVVFLVLQLVPAAAILLSFPPLAMLLGVFVLLLAGTYPLMKRVTYWPQLFLGLNFNWGALLGWAAATGTIGWPAVLLYLGGIFWTLGYDTIYAHQDKADDAVVGVKSSALALGARTRPFLWAVYAAAAALWALAGLAAEARWPFFLILAFAGAHLAAQAARTDFDDPEDCLATFRSNRDLGLIILVGIVLSRTAA